MLAGSSEAAPPASALLWAALAGAAGVGGLVCFYLALSRGTMGLIAPLAAVIGAGLPALVSIVTGERLAELRLAGIVSALVAVVIISMPAGSPSSSEAAARRIDRRDFPLVVLAGLGFAGFYLFLDASAAAGGETWWPLLLVRLIGLLCTIGGLAFVVVALRRGLADVLGLPAL
ncbi:MAG: hypothetical protein M3N29_10045, partial [Chloroflexota bacterium]|nr:hypothetical protein [Chloroflexota bacterium]